MTEPVERPALDGWSLPRVSGRGVALVIVVAILLIGVGAAAVLYNQAEREAAQEEQDLAVRAGRVLAGSADALQASLAGASAVVASDGTVSLATFEAFARGAVSTTGVSVLAFVPHVKGSDRVTFERGAGVTITERGANGLVPAVDRAEYLPVQFVYPATDTARSVIGFDTASDEARLAVSVAARDTGDLLFSPPIPSQPTGQTSVYFAQPLFRPGRALDTVEQRRAAIVGFATGLRPSRSILELVVGQLPAGVKVRITDAGTIVAETESPPSEGHRTTLVEGGRSWVITVEYDTTDHAESWLAAIATVLLAAAVGFLLWRSSRQTDELRSAASSVRELGRLSEQLARADDREQMISIILERTAPMVSAGSVSVALWAGSETALLSSSLDLDESGRATAGADTLLPTEVPVDLASPVGTALVTDAPVLLGDAAAVRAAFPAGWQRSGEDATSAVALPLRRPNGSTMGAIEWVWRRGRELTPGARSTLLTVAEVCEQSLFRAEVQHGRWRGASALAELSQRLSVARTLPQIAELVVRFGPAASGAHFVAVGFMNETMTEMTVHHADPASVAKPSNRDHSTASFSITTDPNGPVTSMLRRGQPIQLDGMAMFEQVPTIVDLVGGRLERTVGIPLIDAEANLRGVIAFIQLRGMADPREPAYTEAGRLDTIADLTAQTVERSLLYQHEHELVLNLQKQTLGELPEIDGLRLAARYLPSSSLLGLGGDWFDIYELDDGRSAVVVGDVAGHGIDAIADMAEFRTTIATLLRTRSSLGDLAATSTGLLIDPDSELRFATVGLMVIDRAANEMSYIRCGHPPAMVRHVDGSVELLEHGGSAPIGIERRAVVEARTPLPSGSVLLAYTDGLVERRDESLDVGIERLRAAFAACPSEDPDVIVEYVIAECLGDRSTNDDTAVLVITLD